MPEARPLPIALALRPKHFSRRQQHPLGLISFKSSNPTKLRPICVPPPFIIAQDCATAERSFRFNVAAFGDANGTATKSVSFASGGEPSSCEYPGLAKNVSVEQINRLFAARVSGFICRKMPHVECQITTNPPCHGNQLAHGTVTPTILL